MLQDDITEVRVTSLEGLGSSYKMSGYFLVRPAGGSSVKVKFSGVAFGGNYGGHNVSVELDEEATALLGGTYSRDEIDALVSEVQRKLLNNEMVVEYDSIKREDTTPDTLGPL